MTDTWNTPRVWVAGEKVTASKKNDESENFRVLYPHTAGGDLAYRDPASAILKRLALGANPYASLRVNSAATDPEWGGTQKCVLYKTATQNVTTGSVTDILWDTELSDINGWHSTSSNTNRITVTANDWYVPFAGLHFTRAGGTGTFEIKADIKHNGIQTPNKISIIHNIDGNVKQFTFGGIPLFMAAGDYIGVSLWQDSGGTCTVYGTDQSTSKFSLVRLG